MALGDCFVCHDITSVRCETCGTYLCFDHIGPKSPCPKCGGTTWK